MRIVQINAVYGGGSTGRSVAEFHEWLRDNGHSSWVFASDGIPNKDASEVFLIGNKVDHKAHALLSRVSGRQACYSKTATRMLVKRLSEIIPDAVILRNLHANFVDLRTLLGCLAAQNIPTIAFLDDCWLFTGKCTHYTQEGCFRWQEKCCNCPKLKSDIPSWFFDRTTMMLEEKRRLFSAIPRLGVVGVSDWILNESQKGILSCASRTKRIYNWLDLDEFRPRGDGFKRKHGIDGKMILCVSSGWQARSQKVHNLDSIAKLIRKGETLVVIGAADEGTMPPNALHLLHTSNTEELSEAYSSADVYLHLGQEDTFGKVIAEALACGTPAVTFDSTAYPELVTQGCGVTVPVGNISSMRKALDEVLYSNAASPDDCRKKAIREFDNKVLIPELLEFIKEVKEC